MPSYKALTGLNYAGKRVEPGDVVSDIPTKSVPWLTEQGLIVAVDDKPVKKREPESPKKEA